MVPMDGGSWFTIPEISNNTGISESTLRRWVKWCRHFLDHKKVKNKRYYSDKSVEIFHKIRELYDEGKNKDEILIFLEDMPTPSVIDTTPVTASESPLNNIIKQNTEALNATAAAIRMIGTQQVKIMEMEQEISGLNQVIQERDQKHKEEITELKKIILKMNKKNETERMDLLNEINAMMLEMMKGNK